MKTNVEGVELEGSVSEFVELVLALKKAKENEMVKADAELDRLIPKAEALMSKIEALEPEPKRFYSKRKVKDVQGKMISDDRMAKFRDVARLSIRERVSINGVARIIFKRKISGAERKIIAKIVKDMGGEIYSKRLKKRRLRRVTKADKLNPEPELFARAEPVNVSSKGTPYVKVGWVKRREFILSRAKVLMKRYQYSYEKALEVARDEYNFSRNNFKASKKPQDRVAFPKFNSIKPEFLPILEGVVRRVIESKGRLDFVECAYTLGLDNVKDWMRFIREFLVISSEVASAFGVKNLFKLQNNTRIVYRDGE